MSLNKSPQISRQLFPIIINSSCVVPYTSNSQYSYEFPAGSVIFKNSKVAVSNISMYYSWYNITSVYGNNTYDIIYPTSTTPQTLTITMPDGSYDITQINSYLESALITAGLYLLDASGNYVYYCQFQANPTYYAIQFSAFPIPTALPSGYSNPASMTFPAVASCPQLTVLANGFRDTIGFLASTYPAVTQSTNYSVLSTTAPQISPVSSVIVVCSLLNNIYSNPQTVLYSFAPDVAFGSIINIQPSEFSFINIDNGQYPNFSIQFLDQNFNRLNVIDNNLVVQLLIESYDLGN